MVKKRALNFNQKKIKKLVNQKFIYVDSNYNFMKRNLFVEANV